MRDGPRGLTLREALHTARQMQQCNNCGGHVSEQFARVFGDNDDEVFACNDCTVLRELFEGGGGGMETSPPEMG